MKVRNRWHIAKAALKISLNWWAGPQVTVSSVQSLSHVQLFATPWTAAFQASLSITNSQSLPKLMSIESVLPSNHLILCRHLLLLLSVFPSIRVFPNELALHIRWPKYWSFSFTKLVLMLRFNCFFRFSFPYEGSYVMWNILNKFEFFFPVTLTV